MTSCYNIGKCSGEALSGNYKVSMSSCGFLAGSGKNKNGGTSYSSVAAMPTVLSIINGNNSFAEDTEGINGGYPLLAWQVQTSK